MPKIAAGLAILLLMGSFLSRAQQIRDTVTPRNLLACVQLADQPVWLEWDLLMNPIYSTQFSSQYYLNGQKLSIKPLPRFYALQPWQNSFLGSTPLSFASDINETLDQASAYYASFRLGFLEKSRHAWLHHIRALIGVTHDKLQSGDSIIYYAYHDGGTEASFMLDKTMTYRLSDLNLKTVSLIFDWNVQAGLFASIAKISTKIQWGDSTIKEVSDSRLQLPNPRTGWGWQVASNFEIGGTLCHQYFISRKATKDCAVFKGFFWFFRRFAMTLGARVMMEGLYSGTAVTFNGQSGYRLHINNYGLFFNGPVLGLKWLSE